MLGTGQATPSCIPWAGLNRPLPLHGPAVSGHLKNFMLGNAGLSKQGPNPTARSTVERVSTASLNTLAMHQAQGSADTG